MMTTLAAEAAEPARTRACTICRDVQKFDLLIEDMTAALGGDWGELSPEEAAIFLMQPEAEALEFVAIAIDADDEDDLGVFLDLVETAGSRGTNVVVIADGVSPLALHRLLSRGPAQFVPYPLPSGALEAAVARLSAPPHEAAIETPAAIQPVERPAPKHKPGGHDGVILSVHSMAGGVGATTFAVNLAWELATVTKEGAPRVCLIDLDVQMGAVASYLDLAQREAVLELLSDTASMDGESFVQALQLYRDRLHVLTAPADMIPLDLMGSEDVARLIDCASETFDYVVIDMPTAVAGWTETVVSRAHVYFAVMEIDMRSAQNALRMIRALEAEELPVEKIRYVLNRAPAFTDLGGKSRVKRMADSLEISIDIQLPNGGRAVTDSNDQGRTLAETAKKSPLRRSIQKIAQSVHELNRPAAEA